MSSPANYNQQVIERFRASSGAPDGNERLLLLTTTGVKSGLPRTSPVALLDRWRPHRDRGFEGRRADES